MANDGRTILGGGNVGGRYVDLQVWIGDPKDPTKGITVENEAVESIDITENLFTTLPTINMVISDSGRFFFRYNIRVGDTLNVRMTPASTTKDEEEESQPAPYIDASFTVQAVTDMPDHPNDLYIHRITGVYAAVSFINKIVQFPQDKSLLEPVPIKKTSAEVMQFVAQQAGLGFVSDVKTDDYSYWLNANETAANFCERVLQHTWIADDDAPVLFTNVEGAAHLTSIKTIAENKTLIQFADMQAATDGDAKTPIITINDVYCLNMGGPISNLGAYKVETSFYTPKNMRSSQMMIEFPQEGQGLLGAVAGTVSSLLGGGTKDRSEAYRVKEYQHNDTYLGGISNKQQSERDNVTIHSAGGIHFDELHDHYEVAPSHNEMIRRSFFQNFVRIMVDTSRQGDLYSKVQYRPYLGATVKCDFSSSKRIDSIHSGEYAVAEITHKYSKGEPYTQAITLVNDGYFDVGE